MKGNIEIHWEVPGKLVRSNRVPIKEVYLESQEAKAKARYKELKTTPFIFNLRLVRVERFCEQSQTE